LNDSSRDGLEEVGHADEDRAAAKRAMEAMMGMKKIDIPRSSGPGTGGGVRRLQLFGHPFSSYTMKALIVSDALTPFCHTTLECARSGRGE
jgi:hypothetical protein